MSKQLTSERRKKLLQVLVTKGEIKVGELAESFGVSTETIRKDLILLEKEGLAQKFHGKAMMASSLVERPYSQKAHENTEEKAQIALAAIELIPKSGTVILDSGSTTYEIAKLLTIHEDLTIFTNSISIMQILSISKNRVFIFGGEIRKSSMALVGAWTLNALQAIEADIVFLGTDGFYSREGPCSASYEEVEIKKVMTKSAKMSVLVCDNSKFKRSDMFVYCGWEDIHRVITDRNAPETEINRIKEYTSIKIVDSFL